MDSFVDAVNLLLLLGELYIVSYNIFIRKNKRKSNVLIYTSFVVLGLFISISFIDNVFIKSAVQFFWCILFIHWLFKGDIKAKVLLGSFLMLFICLLNEFLYTIFLVGSEYLGIRKHINNGTNIYSSFLAYIVTFAVISVVSKKRLLRYLKLMDLKYWLFFFILLLVNSFVITANGYYLVENIKLKRQWVLVNSYFILVFGMFIQIGLMIALIISRNVYREKEYLAAKYLEEQKLHYEYLENRERETKKFRHDIKGHLLLVNDLINKKQYEACETYLQEINVRIDRFSNKISVNNGIADAIVNRFYVEAKQKGIDLQVKGHLPNPCYLSGYDICTILSNLLSNAIEAECAAGGETVHVEFRYTDSEIMLVVENDYIQDLEQSDGAFITTKEDKANHGFGLENVKECIKKNNGQITIDTEKNIFRVLICV